MSLSAGDWNPVVKTDCHITAAASYLHDLAHLSELAVALNQTSDAAAFAARLAVRRTEYHAAFWDPKSGLYGAGTQVAQAVALWTGACGRARAYYCCSLSCKHIVLARSGIPFTYARVYCMRMYIRKKNQWLVRLPISLAQASRRKRELRAISVRG